MPHIDGPRIAVPAADGVGEVEPVKPVEAIVALFAGAA